MLQACATLYGKIRDAPILGPVAKLAAVLTDPVSPLPAPTDMLATATGSAAEMEGVLEQWQQRAAARKVERPVGVGTGVVKAGVSVWRLATAVQVRAPRLRRLAAARMTADVPRSGSHGR